MGQHRYKLICEKSHTRSVTADELQNLISAVGCACPECSSRVSVEDGVGLTCAYCGEGSGATYIDQAYELMSAGCPDCHVSLFVSRSNKAVQEVWKYLRSPKDSKLLLRKKRIDYWEGLIHFCSATEFASIFDCRGIKAASTGYFSQSAVCLTETPMAGWREIMNAHGSFGYVFDKRDVLAHGGGTTFYMTEELIKAQIAHGGFAETIKPFVNLVRREKGKFYDFRHEREWRFPRNIMFNQLQPFAVIVGDLDDSMNWHAISGAVVEYGELEIREKRNE